jgi:CMP/dCMP kinase
MAGASSVPVIAVDGPSGSGKGTIGQLLAARLQWHFLDSGALYRLVGLAARRAGTDFGDADALAGLARDLDIAFIPRPVLSPVEGPPDAPAVMLAGQDVSDILRTEEAGADASKVAAVPAVRVALLHKQHVLRRPPGLVADGRDMGTTVFPDALVKVYLTASNQIRAERRYKQLKQKGFDVNLPRLLDEIRERDARDAARETSPLKPAADAHILDTSDLSISEVVDRILGLLQQRQ